MSCECLPPEGEGRARALTLEVALEDQRIAGWKLSDPDTHEVRAESGEPRGREIRVAIRDNFTFKLPLEELKADPGSCLRLRFSLWHERLPLDALPVEGWLELQVASEEELQASSYNYSAFS